MQNLQAVGTPSLHGPQQFITSQLLHLDKPTVLRGTIKYTEPSSRDPTETGVVCKYRDEDIFSLEREACFYEGELRELQGEAVPRFYGLFKNYYTDGAGKKNHTACIILEYCPSDHDWNVCQG